MIFPSLIVSDLPSRLDIGLPETAALAAVALIGYLFGQRTRKQNLAELDAERQRELERAIGIARQLETIAGTLRQDLANHHSQLTAFKRRLGKAQECDNDRNWHLVCSEADAILAPTMQLAQQISLAYDSIRQQSQALETFSQARIDGATGIANARALEQKLDVLIAAARRNANEFCVAFVCPDAGSLSAASAKGTGRLAELARVIQSCIRGTDFVARYGEEELVVVMPNTKLAGASIFAERLRALAVNKMSASVSIGIAEYQMNDDKKSLLGRADSACYSAKAAGGNCQFVHSGSQIREFRRAAPDKAAEVSKQAASNADATAIAPAASTANEILGLSHSYSADAGV
jgi:diguanylate cyclase (GGDEF)-like protein